MLNVNETCKDRLDEVRAFADSLGDDWRKQFEERLEYLGTYAEHGEDGKTRCDLYTDFAPHSFYFVMHLRDKSTCEYKEWFNGGLIFHGPHDNGGDGGLPTLSVNVDGSYGWSVHT
jgi:hypothetical protein